MESLGETHKNSEAYYKKPFPTSLEMGIETSQIGALLFYQSLPPDSPSHFGSCNRLIQGSWCWVYWSRASEGTLTNPASRGLPPGVARLAEIPACWKLVGFRRIPKKWLTPKVFDGRSSDQNSNQDCWSWTLAPQESRSKTALPPAAAHVSWPRSASPHRVSPGARSATAASGFRGGSSNQKRQF